MELRTMLDVGFEEAVLFGGIGIAVGIAGVGTSGGVVVVAPFGLVIGQKWKANKGATYKVVGKFEAAYVGGGVFEVNDDELFVLIGWEKERGFAAWFESEEVAVLSLDIVSTTTMQRRTYFCSHHYVQRQDAVLNVVFLHTDRLATSGTFPQFSGTQSIQLHRRDPLTSTHQRESLRSPLRRKVSGDPAM